MPRKRADFIEEQRAVRDAKSPEGRRSSGGGKKGRKDREPRKMSANSLANLEKGKATQFQPGQSGNPGGLPGTDLAALYARRFFERDPAAIRMIQEISRDLKGFNAYGFTQLAERAYGKKEHIDLNLSGKLSLEVVLAARKKSGK